MYEVSPSTMLVRAATGELGENFTRPFKVRFTHQDSPLLEPDRCEVELEELLEHLDSSKLHAPDVVRVTLWLAAGGRSPVPSDARGHLMGVDLRPEHWRGRKKLVFSGETGRLLSTAFQPLSHVKTKRVMAMMQLVKL